MKLFIFSLLFFSNISLAVQIDIFDLTNNKRLYSIDTNTKYYNIDLNAMIIDEINMVLNINSEPYIKKGSAIPEDIVLNIIGQYKQSLKNSAFELSVAINQGIKYIPAISFNGGEAVVYGTRDLDGAYKMYKKWMVENDKS